MPLLLTHAMLLFSAIAWFLTGAATPSAGPADIRLIPQIGHSQSLRAAAFSPDGRFIITGSDDKTAKLWDPATGVEVRTFAGHTLAVRTVAFSPDGRLVAAAANLAWTVNLFGNKRDDLTVRLWDAADGAELRVLTGHTKAVETVVFAPDGRSVLTGSWDGTVKQWDVSTGAEMRTFVDDAPVLSLAISPDGKNILTGCTDGTGTMGDLTRGERIRKFRGGRGRMFSIAFSPDGRLVLAGSADGTARLWDAGTGAEIRTFSGHSSEVRATAWQRDRGSIFCRTTWATRAQRTRRTSLGSI